MILDSTRPDVKIVYEAMVNPNFAWRQKIQDPEPSVQTPEVTGQPNVSLERLVDDVHRLLEKLESTRAFGKAVHQPRFFAAGMKLLRAPGGAEALYHLAPRFEAAGVFAGGDWDYPERLQPALVRESLLAGDANTSVECLSELRILALAEGDATHPEMSAAAAREFLEEVLARNLDIIFPEATEATRVDTASRASVRNLFDFIVQRLGPAGIVGALVDECERMILQRRIMVRRIEQMIHTMARALDSGLGAEVESSVAKRARWMIEALHGPTELAAAHPDADAYTKQLAALSEEALKAEAEALGARMDQTGLVCPQHAALLLFLAGQASELIPVALALNRIGQAGYEEYESLVRRMIVSAVTADTARCIYGLSRLLNRGTLFFPPVAPGLQRLMVLQVVPVVAQQLLQAANPDNPPDVNGLLLAGTMSVIGQPRGVDQGHNPTCQSARAISLWAQNDVGYLLELIARAASEGSIVMHFEGQSIPSGDLGPGLTPELHPELDPVSLLLTPHLDRIYLEMSRRTVGRGEDGHRWINPEFHGWWVDRDFATVIDLVTQGISRFDAFVRLFYAAYHPLYNGGRQVVYAQPCGVVSTNAFGTFIGWHAVSIQRVDRDPDGQWRVYFYNPNRDKGQNWGQDIITSTHDHGEYEGESSLPFEQFVMRLYLFHYRHGEIGDGSAVPAKTVQQIRTAVAEGWGSGFSWLSESTTF